ncbi:MAG: AEC family transporter [Propionibacteriaceae bacterium]|jgi:predicted permease|nr:AEC family transporter [Propionibacteriaceae bacterium]
MEFLVTMQQVIMMFCFIGLGLLAGKLGWVTQEGNAGLTKVVIWFVLPALVITSFQRPFSMDVLREMGIAFAASVVSYALCVALSYVIFGRRIPKDERTALRYGAVYANVGFLGVPLVQALFGADGVFFAVMYLAAFNIFTWTHGFGMFTGGQTIRSRLARFARNPNLMALTLGLVLFVASIQLPDIVATGLGYLAGMNAPLSMMVVGVSLATVRWREFLTAGWCWVGVAVRNVAFPMITLGVLYLAPLNSVARMSVLTLASCPVAAFVVMFSVMNKVDPRFATRLMCISTALSILTLPAMLALGHFVLAGS